MTYRLGFVMETSMGHGTFGAAVRRWADADPEVEGAWMPVPYRAGDRWSRVPLVRGNWSLLASLRARDQLRQRGGGLEAVLYHTQLTALLGLRSMRQVPAVLSLDATPANMDSVGEGYDHRAAGRGPLDRLAYHWNRVLFQRAARLVPWSRWARDSLVEDYGVDPARVRVVRPGVDLEAWRPAPGRGRPDRPLRVLFVGGDFGRKGGPLLLDVLRSLPLDWRLDVVTRSPQVQTHGPVRVHRGLDHGSPALHRLFAGADLLALPTLGDCMPLVVLEAMASGLPVVATAVGAIPEQVADGTTGLLVPPRDGPGLSEALRSLARDPERRRRMGAAGRERAERLFSARRNCADLLDVLKECAAGRRAEAAV